MVWGQLTAPPGLACCRTSTYLYSVHLSSSPLGTVRRHRPVLSFLELDQAAERLAGGSLDGLSRCGPRCKDRLMDAKHGVRQHRSIPKPCRQPKHPQRSQPADSTRQGAASACSEKNRRPWTTCCLRSRQTSQRVAQFPFKSSEVSVARNEGLLGSRSDSWCGCRCPRGHGCGHSGRPAGRPGRGHSVPPILRLPRTRCLLHCPHYPPGNLRLNDAVHL